MDRLIDYLAEGNPEGVKKVLLLNGYQQFSTPDQMRVSCLAMVSRTGEKALLQLAGQHPDRELILAEYESKLPVVTPIPITPAQPACSSPACRSFSYEIDFKSMIQLLMFLACVWLTLKLFKDS